MTRRSFRIRQTIGILAVVVCGSPAGLSGQTSPEPTLDYGPHRVGFTVMEALDSTRAFRPLRDFLSTTRRRLEALYGNQQSLSIVSGPGGCTVVFTLPFEE